MSDLLLAELRNLLDLAETSFTEPHLRQAAQRARQRLDQPLQVAIAGRVKTGKSTLLNALVGEQVAATDAAECTRFVTTYQNGPSYRAFLVDRDGHEHQVPYSTASGAIGVSGFEADAIDRLRVEFPSPYLRDVHLIDTPGLSSLTADAGNRARDFLLAPAGGIDADAVIYLMRHLHVDDQGFLEAFGEPDHVDASAVNAIALLSRADEIGGGRTDALDIARHIADQYEREPTVRRQAFVVRPVAALLGLTAETLTEATYDRIDRIAALPATQLDRALLGVTQFQEAPIPGLDPTDRSDLLERFGLMGVRLAVELVAQGLAPSASTLAAALRDRSGLPELRALFLDVFAERRQVLRARTAVNMLDASLAIATGVHGELRRELDRVRTDAHELVELKLLEQLRFAAGHDTGTTRRVEPAVEAEIERLIGAGGTALTRRLGLDDNSPAASVRTAILTAHRRWRAIEAGPATPAALAQSARIVVRSLEVGLARQAEEYPPGGRPSSGGRDGGTRS